MANINPVDIDCIVLHKGGYHNGCFFHKTCIYKH